MEPRLKARSGTARANEGSHSLPATHTEWAMPAFTAQPQSFTAILAGTHFPSRWGQEAELARVS